MKRMIKTLTLLVCLIILTSCSYGFEHATSPYNSFYSAYFIETQDHYIFQEETGWVVQDKKRMNKYPLISNPLEKETINQTISCVKAIDETIYFLCRPTNNSVEIRKINLLNGHESVLYQESYTAKTIELFGVTIWQEVIHSKDLLYRNIHDFFLIESGIVILRDETIDLFDGSLTSGIYEGHYANVTSNGVDIFFTNETGEMIRVDISTFCTTPLGFFPARPVVIDSSIFYLDAQSSYQLSKYDCVTQKSQHLSSDSWSNFHAFGTHFLLTDGKEPYIYDYKSSSVYPLKMSNLEVELDTNYDELFLLQDCYAVILINYENFNYQYYYPSTSS